MQTKTKKITVLMSVYNGDKYLREAIDSILEQTFANFEFLIIDDASTDGTWRIMKEYAARDPRIVLVQNDTNLGLAQSLNKGLAMAKGEYIARMDADDVSLPERLSAQVVFLDKHLDVGLVGCSVQIIDEHGLLMDVVRKPTMHGLLLWALCFVTPFAHPTVFFRKTIVESVGGYDGKLLANQDRDLWQRLSLVTRFANLPNVFLLYRWHKHNISHRHAEIQTRNSAKIGQRMMSSILGYKVPFETCHNIRLGRFETVDDAIVAARLIHPLYDAFVDKHALSSLEKCEIRKDVARILFDLAWQWKHKPQMREFFLKASRLDPFVLLKGLVERARKRTSNVIRKVIITLHW